MQEAIIPTSTHEIIPRDTSTRPAWMQFLCHSISSHFPHPSRMPFALPFLMVTTATLAERFIKKSKMTND